MLKLGVNYSLCPPPPPLPVSLSPQLTSFCEAGLGRLAVLLQTDGAGNVKSSSVVLVSVIRICPTLTERSSTASVFPQYASFRRCAGFHPNLFCYFKKESQCCAHFIELNMMIFFCTALETMFITFSILI